MVQTGLVGRLAMLKANDDTVVQTGPVGRLTMLKARRPMMMPWCRQGWWRVPSIHSGASIADRDTAL